ncbi:MAG: rod shape-determining protein MreC [Oscillospiraceae bacterium]|nr:rod shape-determining protein MreC [Oscillospiraceae bacterium]
MNDFFRNNWLWLLLVAAGLSALLAAGSLTGVGSSIPENAVNVLATPFRSGASKFATWFNERQIYRSDVTKLEEENAALRKQIADMEEAIRQAENDSDENRRLREWLGLRQQRRDLSDLETALITEYAVSNWTAALTLDKGTAHGVEEGDCVIDPTGALVGVIERAGTNWSTMRALIDTDTSVGAQVFRTKELGVLRGEFALMEKGQVRLDYLPADSRLLAGDLVVTSGVGGYYPSGLVIGTVDEVRLNDSGTSPYAILTPQADISGLTQVAIIKSFDIVT